MAALTPRSPTVARVPHAGASSNVPSIPSVRQPLAASWNVEEDSVTPPGSQAPEHAGKPTVRAAAEIFSGLTESPVSRRESTEQVRSRMTSEEVRRLFRLEAPLRPSSPPAAVPGPRFFLETSYEQPSGERVGRTVAGQVSPIQESPFGASGAPTSCPSSSHEANGKRNALQNTAAETREVPSTAQVPSSVSQVPRGEPEYFLFMRTEGAPNGPGGEQLRSLYSEGEVSDGSEAQGSGRVSGEEPSEHSAHDSPVDAWRPDPAPNHVSIYSPTPSDAPMLPKYSQTATLYDYATTSRTPPPSKSGQLDYSSPGVYHARARAAPRAGPTTGASALPVLPAMPTPLAARLAAPEALTAFPSSSRAQFPAARVCAICLDDVPTQAVVVRLACGHAYHPACVRKLFENAASDESLFPPKCCGATIEIDMVRRHLDDSFLSLYRFKEREFGTANRVYCHNPRCSAFLCAAKTHADALCCAYCVRETCACCKQEAHPLLTCSAAAEKVVLDLGKIRRRQRCPSCRTLVDRIDGCPHMTCRCGTQFCYLCGRMWATCSNNPCAR
ncbi:hypothetical protein BD413DRAFT_126320 [Trametes elegans]|nr:hypothetical protein BD413DRAFT_126320 [Trametes elegans]